jgi:hypothetical protein
MSTSGAVAFPGKPIDQDKVLAAVGFPEYLEKAAWVFSLFLLLFPPIAIVGTYIADKTILLSIPLLLMAVCGAFGLRLTIYLGRTE